MVVAQRLTLVFAGAHRAGQAVFDQRQIQLAALRRARAHVQRQLAGCRLAQRNMDLGLRRPAVDAFDRRRQAAAPRADAAAQLLSGNEQLRRVNGAVATSADSQRWRSLNTGLA